MNSPLNERDFAEIRANVLREIARRQRRNAFVLTASVAFAVIALVFVLIPRPLPNRAGEDAGATQKPTARPRVAPAPSPALVVATAQPIKHHHKHHRARKAPPIAIASIELHTANPDVRIIWIPNKETE